MCAAAHAFLDDGAWKLRSGQGFVVGLAPSGGDELLRPKWFTCPELQPRRGC